MTVAKSIPELKKAIASAKHVFVWVVFGSTKEGTQVGGFMEVYKTHVLRPLKDYKLPTQTWDKSISVFFREDDAGNLFVEGFHTV